MSSIYPEFDSRKTGRLVSEISTVITFRFGICEFVGAQWHLFCVECTSASWGGISISLKADLENKLPQYNAQQWCSYLNIRPAWVFYFIPLYPVDKVKACYLVWNIFDTRNIDRNMLTWIFSHCKPYILTGKWNYSEIHALQWKTSRMHCFRRLEQLFSGNKYEFASEEAIQLKRPIPTRRFCVQKRNWSC